jgi:hypothetical protein
MIRFARRHHPKDETKSAESLLVQSPQSRNLRVSSQLPFDIVTAGPEDDAGGAPGLEIGETFTQLLPSARERHLFGVGHIYERVVAVGNVEV